MQFAKSITWLASIIVIVTAVTARGQAPVQFSSVDDAVEFRFFDVATTRSIGNKLIIGFNSGRDPASWLANDFRASTAAFSRRWAMDTISFVVKAPPGYYISKLTFNQTGTASVIGTGQVSGQTTWIVGGFVFDVATFATNPTLSRSLPIKGVRWSTIPVSVTTALSAYSTTSLGSASVSITGAELVAEVAPM
jgi:hypothetical protein